MRVPSPSMQGEKRSHPKVVSETRKVRKPLMEKRRRDRINVCLSTLASLLVKHEDHGEQTSSVPSSETSADKKKGRLEKADILEQTVNHWHKVNEKIEKAKAYETSTRGIDGTAESMDEGESCFLLGYKSCVEMTDSYLKDWQVSVSVRNQIKSTFQRSLLNLKNQEFNAKPCLTSTTSVHETSDNEEEEDEEEEREEEEEKEEEEEEEEENMKETITFLPHILPDGSFALVVKGESIGKTLFVETPSDNQPVSLEAANEELRMRCEEVPGNKVDDIENKLQINEHHYQMYQSQDGMWRPWG